MPMGADFPHYAFFVQFLFQATQRFINGFAPSNFDLNHDLCLTPFVFFKIFSINTLAELTAAMSLAIRANLEARDKPYLGGILPGIAAKRAHEFDLFFCLRVCYRRRH